MTVTLQPGAFCGQVDIIPSKSHLHRLLICAALADAPCLVRCGVTDALDIVATVACLEALGAKIERKAEGFYVVPVSSGGKNSDKPVILPCGESGSTLRFLLPVVCALGLRADFHMEGRLPERPMSPLIDEMLACSPGLKIWNSSTNVLSCEGQLFAADYRLPGNVSSQYITGLLLALPLVAAKYAEKNAQSATNMGRSTLTVTTPIESEDYIEMTLEAMTAFDYYVEFENLRDGVEYEILATEFPFAFSTPKSGEIIAEGDWSNAAFWLAAGAMPGGDVRIGGLNKDSLQGDKKVEDIVARVGADVNWDSDVLHVCERDRDAVNVDARSIPDLIPVLAALAAVSDGKTVISNAARLRLKESDRLQTTASTLKALGADIVETDDGLVINGLSELVGGVVDSFGDHRIAMMAAVASAACTGAVTINGAEAVDKSYPQFWGEVGRLGREVSFDSE